ncbi:Delta(24)-sterol C-methyltransferase [Tulasnella sp. 424]|nr:Delta(24)-sterol C-methyltransferase [Tulasnella sp. 424]KAG8972370.1 Delta(24)-sterol C-methyltransferase [Tulasnella sp. 425]
MSPVPSADGRVNSRVAKYVGFFEKDSTKDGQAHQENRLENYTEVVNGYYDGATELYEYGWGESFHFSRFYKGASRTSWMGPQPPLPAPPPQQQGQWNGYN